MNISDERLDELFEALDYQLTWIAREGLPVDKVVDCQAALRELVSQRALVSKMVPFLRHATACTAWANTGGGQYLDESRGCCCGLAAVLARIEK